MKTIVKLSKIHGNGLFANCDFDRGDLIGVYRGRKAKRDGTYILWVEEKPYYITSKVRYANHSPKPNAEVCGFELIALKTIKTGKEITLHYGEEW